MEEHYKFDKDYTFIFGPIENGNGSVRVIEHNSGLEDHIGINIFDQDFQYRSWHKFPTVVADLIDLAVGIHASDRLALQSIRYEQTRIHVTLPVRVPEVMNSSTFLAKLVNLLGWTTASQWSFEFLKRADSERLIERQRAIPVIPESCEIALWSGGLDALAGLYARLASSDAESFLLFGTGSNNITYARQKQVYESLKIPSRVDLSRIPIRFTGSNLHRKNKISRARGVVFTLLGSACAYLMGQKNLHVYENGIGAINLPYRKSAVGLEHTRSVHPLTLLQVSGIVSELIGEKFTVYNPFLFWTKAEMCKELAKYEKDDLVALTMSCDSPHRQQPTQCGYCSSCILRKQALAASHIKDKTSYVLPSKNKRTDDVSLHLRHMLDQVSTIQSLLNVSRTPSAQWQCLTKQFPILDDIVDRGASAENLTASEMQQKLIQLYQNYVNEWDNSGSHILADFSDQISGMPLSNRSPITV